MTSNTLLERIILYLHGSQCTNLVLVLSRVQTSSSSSPLHQLKPKQPKLLLLSPGEYLSFPPNARVTGGKRDVPIPFSNNLPEHHPARGHSGVSFQQSPMNVGRPKVRFLACLTQTCSPPQSVAKNSFFFFPNFDSPLTVRVPSSDPTSGTHSFCMYVATVCIAGKVGHHVVQLLTR